MRVYTAYVRYEFHMHNALTLNTISCLLQYLKGEAKLDDVNCVQQSLSFGAPIDIFNNCMLFFANKSNNN